MGTFYLPTKFQLHRPRLSNNGDLLADKSLERQTHRLNLILSPYSIEGRIKILCNGIHICRLHSAMLLIPVVDIAFRPQLSRSVHMQHHIALQSIGYN